MAKERVQRRLAAILAADVAGYSRLMGEDEEGTLATLKAYREVIDGLIAGHEGRVFGSAGDSVIAEFASAVEAVRCAVNIQRDLEERNADLPDDHRMRFRIGINLGDVMVDGNNLLGDGVNIAARVEGLAEPGGICISGAVFQQVKKRLDLAYEDLGEREVKNIAEPVSIYLVRIAKSVSPPSPALPNTRPSIAVLPFENMSGDPEQEYFADGLTEDIITALSLWRSFPVIARHSTFTYKSKSVRVQQVAEELGARYVLEGGVRKAGRGYASRPSSSTPKPAITSGRRSSTATWRTSSRSRMRSPSGSWQSWNPSWRGWNGNGRPRKSRRTWMPGIITNAEWRCSTSTIRKAIVKLARCLRELLS